MEFLDFPLRNYLKKKWYILLGVFFKRGGLKPWAGWKFSIVFKGISFVLLFVFWGEGGSDTQSVLWGSFQKYTCSAKIVHLTFILRSMGVFTRLPFLALIVNPKYFIDFTFSISPSST